MGHKVNSQDSKDIKSTYFTTSCNVTFEILGLGNRMLLLCLCDIK